MKHLFFIGFVLLPLIYWPWAPLPYELPRVWFVGRWIEILGCIALVDFIRKRFAFVNLTVDRSFVVMVFTFAMIGLFTSVLGVDVSKSISGNHFRGDGLFTLVHMVGLFLLIACFYDNAWEQATVRTIAVGSFIASVWAVFQWRSSMSVPVSVSFGQPNFLAGYLLVTLPLIATQCLFRKGHMIWSMGLVIQLFAILLTQSRAGIIGITLLVCFAVSTRWRRIGYFLSGTVTLFAVVVIVTLSLERQRLHRLGQHPEYEPQGRERIIRSILRGVAARPLVGFGWANVDYVFKFNPWPVKRERDVYVDKAHGAFLEVLATTGIFGLFVYTAIVLKGFQHLRGTVWILPFVMYVFHSQTNVISIAEESLFWFMLGISAKKPR